MANGSSPRPRSSGLFSGLLLVSLGLLMLLWRYEHIRLGDILRHWWPLIFIVWGLVKFYERMTARQQGRPTGWITAGEIFLVVGVFCIVGVVIIVDLVRQKVHDPAVKGIWEEVGDYFPYDLDMASTPVPPNAHVQINLNRGD